MSNFKSLTTKLQESIYHIDKKIQDDITSAAHDITLNDEIQDDMTSAMHNITLNDKKIQDDITPAAPSKKVSFNCTPHSHPTSTCEAPTPKCAAISSTCATPASKCVTPSSTCVTLASNCATPRPICATATSDLETPKKGISMNLVTPSSTSEESTRPSTANQVAHLSKCSSAASALVALNLASNSASYNSFRPKRRSHHAPTNTSIYPPL